jgi:hypothetical protein
MASLKGKTLFVTGASRGIGLAIALRAARDGANLVVAAKTGAPNPKLPGTIYTAAAEIEVAGGKALPLMVDIRFEEQVCRAVEATVERFGGIDVLINNASAISLTSTLETPMKRFDLMMGVNLRGTYLCSQACLPHLKKAENPHILTLSPPLNMDKKWFAPNVAYTIFQIRNEHVRAGHGRGISLRRHCGECLVASNHDLDGSAADDPPRQSGARAQAGDRGRCSLAYPYLARPREQWQFLHRRRSAGQSWYHRSIALCCCSGR